MQKAKIEEISTALGDHYARTFAEHGETSQGVDWGERNADHLLRLEQMLAVVEVGESESVRKSLLDVGCGFGSLFELIKQREIDISYTGIDLCEAMIGAARRRHPQVEWLVGDILERSGEKSYDYVVCNGILTQKLGVSQRDMDAYLKALVRRMFDMARIGIAFNVMTTYVNFMAPNLYYRNPSELLAWCMSELTPKVRLDHAYPLFEYTLYLYHEDVSNLGCKLDQAGSQ